MLTKNYHRRFLLCAAASLALVAGVAVAGQAPSSYSNQIQNALSNNSGSLNTTTVTSGSQLAYYYYYGRPYYRPVYYRPVYYRPVYYRPYRYHRYYYNGYRYHRYHYYRRYGSFDHQILWPTAYTQTHTVV